MSETPSTAEIKLQIKKCCRGKYPIALLHDGKVLLAERIDPHASRQVKTFVTQATAKFPSMDADALEAQLIQLAASNDELKKDPKEESSDLQRYKETDNGLIWLKATGADYFEIPLTNFTARISADISRDDGVECIHVFEIEARLGESTLRFDVPASQFSVMNWVIDRLGASAIVYPGLGVRDHARTAIQTLSSEHTRKTIYCHTGWRQCDGQWVYIHNGGAIGANGSVEGLRVELPDALGGYELPAPPDGENRVNAIRASLRFLDLGPDEITVPLLCAVYRAPMGECDFSLHVAGPSGVFKTELAALALQHFGATMDARHLPASWISTDNALEGQASLTKDALLVIDDFAPGGTQLDVQKLRQKADRVIRGAGNHAGRGRMRADGSLRPNRPARCLIVSTGEDVPAGHSLRARMLTIEIGPHAIDITRLTACQADARYGLYAGAMADYLRWLATLKDKNKIQLRQEIAKVRAKSVGSSQHARTPEIVANHLLGILRFLQYARAVNALSHEEANAVYKRCQVALNRAAARQAGMQAAMEPAERFLELLSSALTAGTAHLVQADGGCTPAQPSAWGWRRAIISDGRDEWQAHGSRVGWIDGDNIYLDPDASFKAAQSMAQGGDGLAITPQTLRKRLAENGFLIREGHRDELTVRRVLGGVQHHVLYLRRDALLPAPPPAKATCAINGKHPGPSAAGNGGNGGLTMKGTVTINDETSPQKVIVKC